MALVIDLQSAARYLAQVGELTEVWMDNSTAKTASARSVGDTGAVLVVVVIASLCGAACIPRSGSAKPASPQDREATPGTKSNGASAVPASELSKSVHIRLPGNGVNYQFLLLVASSGVHRVWKFAEYDPD